jgi:hypothetical protein
MSENIKYIIALLFGSGVTYGMLRTEVREMKEKIADYKLFGERLASIEGKLDIVLNKQQ